MRCYRRIGFNGFQIADNSTGLVGKSPAKEAVMSSLKKKVMRQRFQFQFIRGKM
jgi:hypothetical protein